METEKVLSKCMYMRPLRNGASPLTGRQLAPSASAERARHSCARARARRRVRAGWGALSVAPPAPARVRARACCAPSQQAVPAGGGGDEQPQQVPPRSTPRDFFGCWRGLGEGGRRLVGGGVGRRRRWRGRASRRRPAGDTGRSSQAKQGGAPPGREKTPGDLTAV